MPTPDDLMGLGLPPFLAGELGNVAQSVTATGTNVGGAAKPVAASHIILANGQSSQTGIILPTDALIGVPYYVVGVGANAPVVYAVSPQVLNAAAGSVTLSAATATGVFIRTSATQWYSIPLAP